MYIRNKKASAIVKSNARYTCIECGSTEFIQGHHRIPRDDSTIMCLCAHCHHKKHPHLSFKMFISHSHQPYWTNKSASSLAKEICAHPRTIWRKAKRLQIPRGFLSPLDELLLKYRKLRKISKPLKKIKLLDRLSAKETYHYARNKGFTSREANFLVYKSLKEIDDLAIDRERYYQGGV